MGEIADAVKKHYRANGISAQEFQCANRQECSQGLIPKQYLNQSDHGHRSALVKIG
jgi:hypothetical protein